MRPVLAWLFGILLLGGAVAAGTAARAQTSTHPGQIATARRDMVVADRPEAAEAGRAILRQGGSAIDAAIAAALVLNVTEPQSAGIGGGGLMLEFDSASGAIEAYDGRETAPAAATSTLFLNPDGAPMDFMDVVLSGRSVGVPGLLKLFEAAHRAHGKLPWAALFQPAIDLATDGFTVSPRLAGLLGEDKYLGAVPAAAELYYRNGSAKPAGSKIVNPALADALRKIAAGGADVFYRGAVAHDIVAALHAQTHPGPLAASDLAAYRQQTRAALCQPYRAWLICGMPPPSSGGIAIAEILGLLERYDLAQMAPLSLPAVHLIAETGRLAFADRDEYVADPDFVPVPVAALLDPAYLTARGKLISRTSALGHMRPGKLDHAMLWPYGPGRDFEYPTTTHISVVDSAGNSVSLTTSIESSFGSHIMVDGFLLNNELTDFSFRPVLDGKTVANRIQPMKRPRSAMAPTLVFDGSGKLVLVLGSPGGPRIIGFVAEALIASLDWNLPIDRAVALPHVLNRNGQTEIERATSLEAIVPGLKAMGHDVAEIPFDSGLNAIALKGGVLQGVADPRREGEAAGD